MHSRLSDPSPHTVDWESIFAEVNAWRGACLHHFSAAEMAVTGTLLTLGRLSTDLEAVRLRQLSGQRFEDLAMALRADGPRAIIGQLARDELAEYRNRQEAFRNLLCHGTLKVMIDRNNQWGLIIRTLTIRTRQPERSVTVITQKEASDSLSQLKRDSQKLASTLGQLRRAIEERRTTLAEARIAVPDNNSR